MIHGNTKLMFALAVLALAVPPAEALNAAGWFGADNWSYDLHVTHIVEGWGSHTNFGVWRTATDGFDAWDSVSYPSSGGMTHVGAYHSPDEDGWEGPAAFYGGDFRAPLTQYGESRTWRIWLWNDPALPAESVEQRILTGGDPVPSHLVTLTLAAKPAGVTGGPPVGTTWDLISNLRVEFYLPTFRTADGKQGYLLELTATLVPEPSSLLALSAGLAGMAGVMRRAGERPRHETRGEG